MRIVAPNWIRTKRMSHPTQCSAKQYNWGSWLKRLLLLLDQADISQLVLTELCITFYLFVFIKLLSTQPRGSCIFSFIPLGVNEWMFVWCWTTFRIKSPHFKKMYDIFSFVFDFWFLQLSLWSLDPSLERSFLFTGFWSSIDLVKAHISSYVKALLCVHHRCSETFSRGSSYIPILELQ